MENVYLKNQTTQDLELVVDLEDLVCICRMETILRNPEEEEMDAEELMERFQ
jgi:hypothetical protein